MYWFSRFLGFSGSRILANAVRKKSEFQNSFAKRWVFDILGVSDPKILANAARKNSDFQNSFAKLWFLTH